MQYLTHFGQYLVFSAVVVLFMWLTKKWRDFATPFNDDHEVEENSNLAVGIRRFGLYIAVAIAMVGAISGSSQGFVNDIKALLIDGIFVVVLLMVAQWVNDALILRSIKNDDEVLKGNSAVGLAEAGSYVATGFILNGAFSGAGGGIGSAILFVVLGQVALVIFSLLYEVFTKFNVKKEISEGNASAGLALGGMIAALGIILRASIAGDFTGWINDIISFAVSIGFGIVLLLVFRKIIDKLFLPHTTIAVEIERDKNVAAIVLAEGCILAVAIIIAGVI